MPRQRVLSNKCDEIYQLYFRYGKHTEPQEFSNLNSLHLELTKEVRENLSYRLGELENKKLLYEMKFNQYEAKYLKTLQAKRGFQYIQTLATHGSEELNQRVDLHALIHKRKTNAKGFLKLVQTKTQIEWINGEIKAIHDMLEYIIKV